MKINFAVVADAANESKEGKANVLGIFTVINSPQIPLIMPCALVIIVQPEIEDVGTDVSIVAQWIDPEHEVLTENILTLSIGKPPFFPIPPASLITQQSLPALKFGPHEKVVTCGSQTIRTAIDVRVVIGKLPKPLAEIPE